MQIKVISLSVLLLLFLLLGAIWGFKEPVIRYFVHQDPSIIVADPNVMGVLQEASFEHQRVLAEKRRAGLVEDLIGRIAEIGFAPILGNPGAPVTVVEFTDYACLPCRGLSENVAYFVASNPQIRVLVFPVSLSGLRGFEAAEQSLLVSKFRAEEFQFVHKFLMEGGLPENVNLDIKTEDRAMVHGVLTDIQTLVKELPVLGLPTFYFEGRLYEGGKGLKELQKLFSQ